MEDETLPSPCPVCGREVIGSFGTHLQLHSKQDLIYTIINQHDALGLFDTVKTTSSQCTIDSRIEEHHERARRSTSPPKKSHQRTGSSRRRSSGSAQSRDAPSAHQQPIPLDSISEIQVSEPAPTAESPEKNHEAAQSSSDPLTSFEVEIRQFDDGGAIEPETTEIMPLQICSYISDPGVEDTPNEPNPQLQTLYPVDTLQDANSHPSSHSNFIQYIIETPVPGNDANPQELEEWILPGGRSIPVFSALTEMAPVPLNEDPLSLDGDNSYSLPDGRVHLSTQDVDLMTDEEIPPRGEISEYEESNTSSHQSDELNKPGVMNIGSTLGSLFSGVRRLSPVTEERIKDRRLKAPRKQNLSPTALQSSSGVGPSSTRLGTATVNRHKCPEPNCTQVGSIFELAQHQEKVHQRKYKGIKKETSSQSGSRPVPVEEKPILTPIPPNSSGYRCFYCEFQSYKLKILQGHIEASHPGKPFKQQEYECRTCGKIFQKRTNLNKHLLIHGVKKFQCHCGKAFTSGFKLMEHGRVHTKLYPFECAQCQRNFRTPSLLKAHLARVHPQPGEVKPIIPKKIELFCSICSRVLHSKRSYTKHLELHNETTRKCPICYETFPRNAILTRHIRVAHDSSYETKESKDCPICFKKMHPNSMKSHMRIHNDEKPFCCPVCSKTFRTSANLTSHSWSHTNAEKPFKCTLCSKSYLFKKCLEAHLIVHKKRRFHFVCNECGMKFTSKVNLKRHCQEHFSEKKYKCKLCQKKFHRKYYLVEHERIHNGSKPYTCSICGKSSTTRSNHRAHIKIHDARESGTQEG